MTKSKVSKRPEAWIVLGDRQHGISYGPFTEAEAKRFVSEVNPYGIALPWSGACSQIETCASYGLTLRALPR